MPATTERLHIAPGWATSITAASRDLIFRFINRIMGVRSLYGGN